MTVKAILKLHMADMAWHEPVERDQIKIFERLVLARAEFELLRRGEQVVAAHPDLGDWRATVMPEHIEQYV